MEQNWIRTDVALPTERKEHSVDVLLPLGEELTCSFNPNPYILFHDLCGIEVKGVMAWKPVEHLGPLVPLVGPCPWAKENSNS